MYSRQEASLLRKNFWTSFGQYMRPLKNAAGEPVNWVNYKTGIRNIYFRMDAGQHCASIAIELRHDEPEQQQIYLEKLRQVKNILEEQTKEEWQWQLHQRDEDGKLVSRITMSLTGVNIFAKSDWPAMISFFKPRIMALDRFWNLIRDNFD